jgi:uncharacterized protein (DUF1778 family)
MPATTRRDTPINIRATAEERQLIDQAAKVLGKSRTEFVLESARRAAQEALLDQTHFVLDDDTFETALSILDAPPEPTQALRDLMAGKKRPGSRK